MGDMYSFHLISLGCAKNLVDSEVMIGTLTNAGFQLVDIPEKADFLIINTCGFIQAAVEEGIQEIFKLVRIKEEYPKKTIVVVGCLVQRYKEKLARELPEVDLFVGTEGIAKIGKYLTVYLKGKNRTNLHLPKTFLMSSKLPRVLSAPSFRAYLKITEGCDNRCTYCMIPHIRGGLRSRSINDLVQEAKKLEDAGVVELSIIAQDTTAYGNDLGSKYNLERLLKNLLFNTKIPWIRVLYLYPTGITDRLLEIMAGDARIVPYLDIPLQHVNDKILAAMNRRYTSAQVFRLIDRVRNKVPKISLRTTFLVGFPGEDRRAFQEIEQFLMSFKIDHVGVFAYSNEEGALSENFAGQVSANTKKNRVKHLLEIQAEISASLQQRYLGCVEPVLIEGLSSETDLLLQGRTKYQAPDVDGCVLINDGYANPGDIVNVLISESQVYDLVGGIIAS